MSTAQFYPTSHGQSKAAWENKSNPKGFSMRTSMTLEDLKALAEQEPAERLSDLVIAQAHSQQSASSLHSISEGGSVLFAPTGFSMDEIARNTLPHLADALKVHINWATYQAQPNGSLAQKNWQSQRFGDDRAPGMDVALLNGASAEQARQFAQQHPTTLVVQRYHELNSEALHQLSCQMNDHDGQETQSMDKSKTLQVVGWELNETADHPLLVLTRSDARLGALYLLARGQELAAGISAAGTTGKDYVLQGSNPLVGRMMQGRVQRQCPEALEILNQHEGSDPLAVAEVLSLQLAREGVARLSALPTSSPDQWATSMLQALQTHALQRPRRKT